MSGLIEAGTTVGNWRVVRYEDSGATADVYRACRRDDESVIAAMKVLRECSETAKKRFRIEIARARQLGELDGFVKLIECGEYTGRMYYLMTWMERFPVRIGRRAAVHHFIRLAETMNSLHERNLVHVDLKPRNFGLVGGKATIGDLGSIQSASHPEEVEHITCTPGYAAKELLEEHIASVRADVHALGMALKKSADANARVRLGSAISGATDDDLADRYHDMNEFIAGMKKADADATFRDVLKIAAMATGILLAAIAWLEFADKRFHDRVQLFERQHTPAEQTANRAAGNAGGQLIPKYGYMDQ